MYYHEVKYLFEGRHFITNLVSTIAYEKYISNMNLRRIFY